jgi:hypothetical protein
MFAFHIKRAWSAGYPSISQVNYAGKVRLAAGMMKNPAH